MRPLCFLSGCLAAATFMAASGAHADCFSYKSDSFAEPEILRGLQQTKVEENLTGLLNGSPEAVPLWIAANEYIIVQIAAQFAPKVLIAKEVAGSLVVRAQSFDLQAQDGLGHAEVHYSGRDAHDQNGTGWINIYYTSQDDAPFGAYGAWIVHVQKMTNLPDGYCDAAFIPFQGGFACDTCVPPPPQPGGTIEIVPPGGSECPPGTHTEPGAFGQCIDD